MGYHNRIETTEYASFQTTRCRNSELWFVNNPALEQAILARTAKACSDYQVQLYGLAIEGNHIQFPAYFPHLNRAAFMQQLNSGIAGKDVPRHVPSYPGGGLWGRRYSQEFLPSPADIERQFFYTVLQAVQDGLVERLSDYPGYNCFHDAVWGREREFRYVRWQEYNAARKRNPQVHIKEYTDTYLLKYQRLPGYEHLPQREYALMMERKLEEHRLRVVEERRKQGLGFMGPQKLRQVKPGSLPLDTKTSTEESHRPRVLCSDPELREKVLAWYFEQYYAYKEASKRYRAGELTVKFPPGTYRPSMRYVAPT